MGAQTTRRRFFAGIRYGAAAAAVASLPTLAEAAPDEWEVMAQAMEASAPNVRKAIANAKAAGYRPEDIWNVMLWRRPGQADADMPTFTCFDGERYRHVSPLGADGGRHTRFV